MSFLMRAASLIFIGLMMLTKIDAQEDKYTLKLKTIIENETKKYPQMEVSDVYKLLYQAEMGSEHAVTDSISARKWMKNEIANLKWNYEEELIDSISPGGKIVRVNLRPYLKAGYDPNRLLTAFIKTANSYKGKKENLEIDLKKVLKLINKDELPFSKKEAEKFFDEMKRKDYPSVHHSKKYEELYSPAYRVISGEFVPYLLQKN